MKDRESVVCVGILGFFGFVVLAYNAPGVVSELLMAFSVVAFVFGVVGLLKPAWARLPNRAAAVWAWAVSVGLFVGGGMLSAPPQETVRSDVVDAADVVSDPDQIARGRIRGFSNCIRDAAVRFGGDHFESCRRSLFRDGERMRELRAAGLAVSVEGMLNAAIPVLDDAERRSTEVYVSLLNRLADDLRAISLGDDNPDTSWPEIRHEVRLMPINPCAYSADEFSNMPLAEQDKVWEECRQFRNAPKDTDLMLDTMEGMIACQDRLQDAARVLYGAGAVYRWTSPRLGDRFSDARRPSQGVRTLIGDAIEFLDEDGSWLRAIYECDVSTETGQVVDVRTRPGSLR